MEKEEKEKFHTPVLGFSAVLVSIVAFLLVLYLITIVIRILSSLG